jgi:serine/threonine-protein kinase
LEKKPDRRYPSAEALADDLDRFLNGTPPVAPELTWRRRAVRSLGRHRRGLTWAGVAVLATVLVLVLGAAFQPKDPLKKMQQDLAAGRPVTLIGERGNPAWHQWVLGAPEFIPSPMGDGTCSFESLGWAMADLCPDPMTDHYVLRAEFRQLTSRRARVEPVAVGIYFGRASCPGANGFNAHTFFTVSFFDFPKYPDSPEHARFERFIMIQRPGGLPNPSSAWLKSTPFDQAEQLPGPWRAIELEVTPERVRASWPGKDGKMAVFADFTAEKMRAEYAKLNEHLHHPTMPRDHGIVLPDWNPRMPLGIFSARAAISVRNVTLTPQK